MSDRTIIELPLIALVLNTSDRTTFELPLVPLLLNYLW